MRSLNTSARYESSPRVVFLEEKHMVSILLFLMDNDGCMKSQLYDSVSRGLRMPDKLDMLEDAGLIVQESDGPYRSVTLRLTDLGREVCRELVVIEEMLERYDGRCSLG